MKDQFTSLISFYINDEVFAFDTLKVRNILEYSKMTSVPNVKEYILGVINLHGNIIPVADLRMMMGMEKVINNNDTSVIVVSNDDKSESLLGIVVDSVKEVFDTEGYEVQTSVFNGSTGLVGSFMGTIHKSDSFVHIIDLDELVQEIEK